MADFPEPTEPCREIVVVPPRGVAFEDPDMLRQMRDFLNRSFPEFSYIVAGNSDMRGDTFKLIPVLGAAGSGEASMMLKAPPPTTIREIREALRQAFENSGGAKLQ